MNIFLALVLLVGLVVVAIVIWTVGKVSFCFILTQQGFNETEKGNYDKALEYYNKSLQLTSNQSAIATIYNAIGLVYRYKGDKSKAIEYFKKAMQIYQENGDSSGIVSAIIAIALTYIDFKDFSEAEYFFTQIIGMMQKVGDKYAEANAYEMFGKLYLARNQEDLTKDLAREHFTKSYDLYKSIGNDREAQRIYETYLKQ
jgi:tetratricopeptide (TPR) repeat protein